MLQKTCLLLLILCSITFSKAQENYPITSDIQLKAQENNLVTISGVCNNNSLNQQKLNYSLNVQKISEAGNTSNNRQNRIHHYD